MAKSPVITTLFISKIKKGLRCLLLSQQNFLSFSLKTFPKLRRKFHCNSNRILSRCNKN